ncbi:MAG: DUF309 domain-containing protein [Verrucomicrobiota bacterium]
MNKRERISDFVRELDPAASPREGQDYYRAFFRLWNAQRYYEAHDVLEQLWLAEKDKALARFYQGLIQAAGAFVHLQKNFEHPTHAKHGRRIRPATRLFTLALKNLEHVPDVFRSLDTRKFRELLVATRDDIIAADYEKNPFSPETAPLVSLHLQRKGERG